jgi:hypothetical protein
MTAMPLLSRQPETPHTLGLLIILGLILLVATLRFSPFFLHQVFGVR